ncbi:hypothetical protein Celaphus_00003404, partial [Cervus elaphus hippelaphus]
MEKEVQGTGRPMSAVPISRWSRTLWPLCQGQIFYESCKETYQKQELPLWYGDCYEKFLDILIVLLMGSLGLTMNQDSQVILILRRVRLTYQGLETRRVTGPPANCFRPGPPPLRVFPFAPGDLPKPRRRLRSLQASPSHGHLSNVSLISQVLSLIQRSLSQLLPSPSSPARARLLSSPSSSPDFAFMGNRRLSAIDNGS